MRSSPAGHLIILQQMKLTTNHMVSLFDQGISFIDLLPYAECHDGYFILTDGSIGRLWKVGMIDSEGKSDAVLSSMLSQWEDFLVRIPSERVACQVILQVHGQSKKVMFEYKSQPFIGKRMDLYISLRYFPVWKKNSHSVQREFQSHLEDFKSIVLNQESILSSMGVTWSILQADDLVCWLYMFLNPKRSEVIPHKAFDPHSFIKDQVLFHAPQAQGGGFIFENVHMSVLSLKELPAFTQAGMFTKELYEGNRFCLLDMGADLLCVMNLTLMGVSEAMNQLNMHKNFAFMHRENFLGDKSVEALEKKKELDETIAHVYRSNKKIVKARMHWVIAQESKKENDAACGVLLSGLNRLGAEAIKEELIGASLLLTCLPLNFDPYYERFIRRERKLTSANAADMLPVMGSFAGTKTLAQKYFNRRGQEVGVDFFDSNTNPHGMIIGASGAGKSFFVNDFILQNQRLDAHFFVLDKGDSYKKLNALLKGQYVCFDLNDPVTINPFVHPPTPENITFLMSLLVQMATGSDERDRLNRQEEGLLQRAVGFTYEKFYGQKEITLSDLIETLNNNSFNDQFGINSLMGPTLALRLTPFTQKGQYGRFFDGKNTFSIKGSFSVFELANLNAYPDVQMVVLLNLMFFMTNFVSSAHMRPVRKYLIIDEAWSLLRFKNSAEFITNAFKTFRKYRCAVVAVTQEIADLTRQECGLAIIANSANKVFLKQELSVLHMLKSSLSIDDEWIKAMATLETVKGKFSESYCVTDSAVGVIRLVPSPFLYWVASSEAKMNEYLSMKAVDYGGDLMKALEFCAKEHPHGLA